MAWHQTGANLPEPMMNESYRFKGSEATLKNMGKYITEIQ